MKGVQRHQGSESHSFLLDDNSSSPFDAAEAQQSMSYEQLYGQMAVPDPLRGIKAFAFLQRDLKLCTAAGQPQL